MKLLLDTHALLWFLAGDDHRLGPVARAAIVDPDNDICVSVVSLWEIAVKVRIGKLEASVPDVFAGTSRAGLSVLGLEAGHLLRLMHLPFDPQHRDPFDHLLLAQALAEGLTFVSEDGSAHRYGVPVLKCSA